MTKEHFENRVKKYIANAKTLDSMDAEQAEAINELKKTLKRVVSMLCECHDIYMSDVGKLERGYNLLSNAFDTEPTEWELDKFAELDIQWPPKSKTKVKGVKTMSFENEIDNEEMIEIVSKLQGLPEYRRKEIAILLMHSTLNGYASEQLAGFAAGLAQVKQAEQADVN